ncbi:hypothetical protein DFQ30_003958 [Apophysomyces sp. BC1015]|nr:hypothetical protein DFQ30_003958 [Apophysomyces sp. BC1015]
MDAATTVTDEELARQIQEQERHNNEQDIRAPIAPKHDILSGGGPMFDHGRLWGVRDRAQGRQQTSVFNQGDSSSASPGLDYIRGLGAGADTNAAAGIDVEKYSRPSTSARSPTEAAASAKAKRLADLFRPPFDIMFVGAFEEARNTARDKDKWLLINIQDPTEFSCQVLNRDLWSDSFVKDIVRESFIFLQYSNESPEGKRYLTYYPIKSYPHVAVIDARTGERVKYWENQMSPTDFMMEVTEFLEQQSPGMVHSTTMKRPRVMKNVSDMSEEEQINAAIAASLQGQGDTTTEDSTPTSAAAEPATPHEEEVMEDETTERSPLDLIQPIRRDEPTELANSTRIQLRMADGKRIIRRFMKSDPVRYLFEFVKSEVPETQNQPFELVFNRKQLIDFLDQPIQEAGLENAAVNFVFT